MYNWNTFGVQTSHMHTQTHKTQQSPNLGEVTTFPLIVFSVINQGATSKCHFVLGLPS
jgi:phage-related protein